MDTIKAFFNFMERQFLNWFPFIMMAKGTKLEPHKYYWHKPFVKLEIITLFYRELKTQNIF